MRKLSAKWVPKCLNADQKRQRCQSSEQHLEFFRLDLKDFLSRLVTMDETWLYHYDPETKQQSMELRRSSSPRPPQKIPSAKIRWKSSRLGSLGSRRHPPHWLSSKGPNYQHGVLLISVSATEGHFEGKMPRDGHQGGLVLAQQWPGSSDTCNPGETDLTGLLLSWSPILFSGSGPRRTTTCSVDWKKNNWKFSIFRPTRRSFLSQRPGWTDNVLIFLGACRI